MSRTAQENRRRKDAYVGLAKMVKEPHRLFTRREIFGRAEPAEVQFQKKILKYAAERGILEEIPPSGDVRGGRSLANRYRVRELETLTQILNDVDRLTALLWPGLTPIDAVTGQVPIPVVEEVIKDREEKAAETVECTPHNGAHEVAPPTSLDYHGEDPDDYLGKVLKVILENLIYIRKRVDMICNDLYGSPKGNG